MGSGSIKVTCLGTGTSHGVPMIGCNCPVCTSADPHDKRTRASILIEYDGAALLVDTGPELRVQCLANNVKRIDAVLYTHHHADHVAGLDDLRRFNWINRSALRCYGAEETLSILRRMFAYVFDDDPEYPSHKPQLELVPIADQPFELFGRNVTPIPLWHGRTRVLGYRVGRFAYCTDCNEVPAEAMERMKGLDVLILDALRRRPHPTHFTIEEAVAMAERIGAERTFFTHMAHELGHEATNAELPHGMALAYDGQVIEVEA